MNAILQQTTGILVGTVRESGRLIWRLASGGFSLVARPWHTGSTPKEGMDDVTLARKVETEIFRGATAPKGSVDVNAVDGVVYLRGEVKRPGQIKTLEARTRAIPEVRGVENLLHLPETPSPTRADTPRRAQRTGTPRAKTKPPARRAATATAGQPARRTAARQVAEQSPEEAAAASVGRTPAPLGSTASEATEPTRTATESAPATESARSSIDSAPATESAPAAAESRPATGFPEPPGRDPEDRSGDADPHHALNVPVGEPDPTEWPDPYDKRDDPRDPPDPDQAPFGEQPHPSTGATSTSEPHPAQDPEAEPWEGPKRDKVDE